jgi:hypothetical protein
VWQTDEMVEEWELPDTDGKLVLLSGDGHEFLALRYDDDDAEPCVVALSEGETVRKLADTFELFLHGLEFREPDAAVVALLPTSPAVSNKPEDTVLAEVRRLVAAPVLIEKARLWRQDNFLEDGQATDVWFLSLPATSAEESARMVADVTAALAPSFSTQLIAPFLNSGDAICVLEN